jgi:hypothetical protein
MLAWLVDTQAIAPHIHVFDKSERTDGTFSRDRRGAWQRRPAFLPHSIGTSVARPALASSRVASTTGTGRTLRHVC